MYWPLLNMYSENFEFGPGGFIIRGTILIRGKGLMPLDLQVRNVVPPLPRNCPHQHSPNTLAQKPLPP